VLLIDRELFRFEEIWAAAGHPNCVCTGATNSSNSLGLSIRSKSWSDW